MTRSWIGGKKDADRSNGPIIVRNPTPILYEETLWKCWIFSIEYHHPYGSYANMVTTKLLNHLGNLHPYKTCQRNARLKWDWCESRCNSRKFSTWKLLPEMDPPGKESASTWEIAFAIIKQCLNMPVGLKKRYRSQKSQQLLEPFFETNFMWHNPRRTCGPDVLGPSSSSLISALLPRFTSHVLKLQSWT